jgi:hypothetical protein
VADEYVVPIQTGSSFAADDVAGKKVQRLKLAQGLDGVADDVTAANPLPGDVGRVRTNTPASSSSDVLLVQPIGATGTILTPTTSTAAGFLVKPPPSLATVNIDGSYAHQHYYGFEGFGDAPFFAPPPSDAVLVITGYALTGFFSDTTGPTETWLISLTTTWDATFGAAIDFIRGQGGRMEYSGGIDAPAMVGQPETVGNGLGLYVQRQSPRFVNNNPAIQLCGHVSYYFQDDSGPL